MIPKRIVYTWFSNGAPEPRSFRFCLRSWQEHLPDYEIVRLSAENVAQDSPFIREAIRAKRWVQASNYARLDYLYRYGGFYMDVDMQVVRPFHELRPYPCIIGAEDHKNANVAIMGAEPGHWFMKECLDYLEGDFTGSEPDKEAFATGPGMVTAILQRHGWQPADRTVSVEDVQVFESKYFYPFHFDDKFRPECVTPSTYCIHWWSFSWLPWQMRLRAALLGRGPIGDLRKWVATKRGRYNTEAVHS